MHNKVSRWVGCGKHRLRTFRLSPLVNNKSLSGQCETPVGQKVFFKFVHLMYHGMRRCLFVLFLSFAAARNGNSQRNYVLNSTSFKHYIDAFNHNDNELYKQLLPNDSAWIFLASAIPFFECPDKNIELTYYFRWWTFRKHIKQTATGCGFALRRMLPVV